MPASSARTTARGGSADVVDVDRGRERAAARRPPAAAEDVAEQLVHLAPHALEVGEQVAVRRHEGGIYPA